MKWIIEHGQLVGVELTRRNLETLLAKLDRNVRIEESKCCCPAWALQCKAHEEHSECTIAKQIAYEDMPQGHPVEHAMDMFARAVENEEHYEAEGRPAGMMHDLEEPLISRPKTGVM